MLLRSERKNEPDRTEASPNTVVESTEVVADTRRLRWRPLESPRTLLSLLAADASRLGQSSIIKPSSLIFPNPVVSLDMLRGATTVYPHADQGRVVPCRSLGCVVRFSSRRQRGGRRRAGPLFNRSLYRTSRAACAARRADAESLWAAFRCWPAKSHAPALEPANTRHPHVQITTIENCVASISMSSIWIGSLSDLFS
jgi:hypothetical protein